jgi:transposase
MLSFGRIGRVFLARAPQDMRRGIDSLVLVVQRELEHDPFAGDCFVFLSRDRRRLKALLWEDGGFWLCLKRLERGTFAHANRVLIGDGPAATVTPAAMHALLEGIDAQKVRYRRRERTVLGKSERFR